MCAWFIFTLLVFLAALGYCQWVLGQELDYWIARCHELDTMLKHVSDMETIEARDKRSQKAKMPGIDVKFDSN